MSRIEQELLLRTLIDLFLANPRKRTYLHRQVAKEDPQKQTITTDGETKQQRTGGETNDQKG
jgi:hypothetical protein